MIRATAPVRIDMAGGTLDIYPLYLFTGGGLTVNAAIDLRSEVVLSENDEQAVTIKCENLYDGSYNISETFVLDSVDLSGKLSLLKRLIRFYSPDVGIDMEVKTRAPPGSGLGGSSSIAMAVSAALGRLTGRMYKGDHLVNIACNIEAQDLGVPAGRQDHYAALDGGFNAISFGPLGAHAEKMRLSASFLGELQDMTTLCYTGESRFSGNTNWDMFKRFVDKDAQTLGAMKRIRDIAEEMKRALLNENYSAVCEALRKEWEHRKRLANGVTTPAIEKIISASGCDAAKVCGAGGGGCIVLLGEVGREKVEAAGGKILDFEFDEKGLEVF